MPGRDGTGPWGRGAMTGRGLGYCPGVPRYGYGRWCAPGYGRGWRWFATPQVDAKELMKAEMEALQRRLDYLKEQLDNLDEAE